jgi:hypothetical protein
MTNVVSVVGMIVAIVSLTFSGWQARLLARQAALQTAETGTSTLQQLFNWLHDVQMLLIREPRLLPYFRDGYQEKLTAGEEARLRLIAAMYCDVLNIGLHTQQSILSTRSLTEWRQYCSTMLATRPVLADEVRLKPDSYPLLAEMLTSSVTGAN